MDALAFTLEQLLAARAAAEAALAAEKKASRKAGLPSIGKFDFSKYTYYSALADAGGKTPMPEGKGEDEGREVRTTDKEGRSLVPYVQAKLDNLFKAIKLHEKKFAAMEAPYKLVIDLLETQIREAQGAEAECDKFYADMERELDPEGAAERDAEDELDDEAAEAFDNIQPAEKDPGVYAVMDERDKQADKEAHEDNTHELEELERIETENAPREAPEAESWADAADDDDAHKQAEEAAKLKRMFALKKSGVSYAAAARA